MIRKCFKVLVKIILLLIGAGSAENYIFCPRQAVQYFRNPADADVCLALVEAEPVVPQSRHGHPRRLSRLDAHRGILHHKAFLLRDPQGLRRIMIDLRIGLALLKLPAADDQIKYGTHPCLLHDPGDQLRTS